MDAAGFQFQKAHRIFRDGTKDDFVQIGTGGFVPVVFVFFQDNLIVFDPFDEFERTGSNGVTQELFGVFREGRRADDVGKVHAHVGQKWCFDSFELENHRVLTRGLDGADGIIHFHGNPVFGRTFLGRDIPAFAEEFNITLFHHAADGKYDCIGIEGRAVMKLDTLAQFEGVGLAVR